MAFQVEEGLAMNEADIIIKVDHYLSTGFPLTFREIPLAGRYVDLVGYDPKSRRLVMVEAKMTNWRRAIQQALSCRLITDEVYIAMPLEFAHRVDIKYLSETGIGLLAVGEEVVEMVKPGTASVKTNHYIDRVCSFLDIIRNSSMESGGI